MVDPRRPATSTRPKTRRHPVSTNSFRTCTGNLELGGESVHAASAEWAGRTTTSAAGRLIGHDVGRSVGAASTILRPRRPVDRSAGHRARAARASGGSKAAGGATRRVTSSRPTAGRSSEGQVFEYDPRQRDAEADLRVTDGERPRQPGQHHRDAARRPPALRGRGGRSQRCRRAAWSA